jgi:hypothetical protein
MQRKVLCISTLLLASIFSSAADAPKKPEQAQPTTGTLALSPGAIEVKTQPGLSNTQVMTMTNLTGTRFRFVLEALDVVTRDGKRVFVPSGETEGGIARSAVFDPPAIALNPGEAGQVKVTLTIPPEPKVRAVVAIFHSQNELPGKGTLMVTGSLGMLITYNLSTKMHTRRGAGREPAKRQLQSPGVPATGKRRKGTGGPQRYAGHLEKLRRADWPRGHPAPSAAAGGKVQLRSGISA